MSATKYILILLLSVLMLSAQDVKIRGQVVEQGTNIPLEYATVTFRSSADNKIITGGITDLEGKFSIEVKAGTYNIDV